MVALLLFLFPAGISLKVKDDYFNEELKNKDYIFLYMKYTSLINTLMFIVLFLYSGDMNDLISYISKYNIKDISIMEPDLEEVFMHYYKEEEK